MSLFILLERGQILAVSAMVRQILLSQVPLAKFLLLKSIQIQIKLPLLEQYEIFIEPLEDILALEIILLRIYLAQSQPAL